MYGNVSIYFLEHDFTMISPGCFNCSNSRDNFEMTVDVWVINNFNFLYGLPLSSGVFYQQLLLKIQNHIDQ